MSATLWWDIETILEKARDQSGQGLWEVKQKHLLRAASFFFDVRRLHQDSPRRVSCLRNAWEETEEYACRTCGLDDGDVDHEEADDIVLA